MPRKRKQFCIEDVRQDVISKDLSQQTVDQAADTLRKISATDLLSPDKAQLVALAHVSYHEIDCFLRSESRVPQCFPARIRDKLLLEILPLSTSSSDSDALVKLAELKKWGAPFKKAGSKAASSADLAFLGPPTGNCLSCSATLTTHNQHTSVKFASISGHVLYKRKITLRCKPCSINYLYDKFGNSILGYQFYDQPRDGIVATDGVIIERRLYDHHCSLAQHAWVSFVGFAESWHSAHQIAPSDEIDRRVWGEAFWWGQVEEEMRETNAVAFRFKRDEDREQYMEQVNNQQARTLYPHPESSCTTACKARGITTLTIHGYRGTGELTTESQIVDASGNHKISLQSMLFRTICSKCCGKLWVTDGIWKIQFAHCMFVVKNVLGNIPLTNYPNVCTNAPLPGQAFCKYHCQICKSHSPPIPTGLRDFLKFTGGVADSDLQGEDESTSTHFTIDHNYSRPSIQDLTNLQFIQNNQTSIPKITANCGPSSSRCSKDLGERQTLRTMSRGHQFVVRAGGHIDAWTPLYKSESPGQVFIFILAWLFCIVKDLPVDAWRGLWLAYDNMCQLNNVLAAKQPLPLPAPFSHMWMKINKMIDSLHIANHKDTACHTDLHPDLFADMYPDLKNTKNTQAAEQTFVWLGRFKKIVCSMHKAHHLFFIHRMVKQRNAYTAKCYAIGRKPLLPGVRNAMSS